MSTTTAIVQYIVTKILQKYSKFYFYNTVYSAHNENKIQYSDIDIQGDTKETIITKNRITSKILFRLKRNCSYIRSSLCSRHLQRFKSVLQKLFVSLALKKCAPIELPAAAGTFGPSGQSSR